MISLIQQFEADFLWKVSLKILNSGVILQTFTHVFKQQNEGMDKYNANHVYSRRPGPGHLLN